MENTGALEGLKVLDMGRVIAAPFCSSLLADMGAEVIKIEVPGKGDDARYNLPKLDGESTYFMNFNRSKKGITLDLKKGKEVFLKLVNECDVIVENFRPGVMDKLGLGYDELKKVNPKIIYAAISGFGQTGPYNKRAGFDPIAQAMSGIMGVTGWPDTSPTRCGASIADTLGGLNAAVGILAALQYRNKTGKGQMIDISLVDVSVVAMGSVNQVYLTDETIPTRQGNGYVAGSPGGSYKAKDGDVVLIALGEPLWKKLCNAIGRQDLLERSDFKDNETRVKNKKLLDKIIEEWTTTKTVDEILNLLSLAGLPAAPILNVSQVVNDPHIGGVRQMFTDIDHPLVGKVKITNQGIKMSETNPYVRSSSPMLGEHNTEIYTRLGFTKEEIEIFKKDGII